MPQIIEELTGLARTRPIRIAYLVEPGEHADLMLDGIFADCYARWGGRFSLIIPCADGAVMADYWPWLESYDPDVVYSYVELSDTSVLDLHERVAPANYLLHRLRDAQNIGLRSFRPTYPFSALSAMSTIFRLGRHSPSTGGARLKVIDTWRIGDPCRFVGDNFGTYHASAVTAMYPNDARSIASLLTIVSDEDFERKDYAVPRDIERIPSGMAALRECSNRRATTMSILSAIYAPRFEVRDQRWSTGFNLVLGDSFEDRLMFWNARLLTPSWLDADLCCFRITLDMLSDADALSHLVHLLNTHNHVTDGNGGQANLYVRSASHSQDELNQVVALLRGAKVWSATGRTEVVPGGHVIPHYQSLKQAQDLTQAAEGLFKAKQGKEFRWVPPTARPPALQPEHLDDAPSAQLFTLGLWALDLSLEYSRDSLRFGDTGRWMLPKRWRVSQAFGPTYSKRYLGQVGLSPRTSRHGDLSAFAGRDQVLESVSVPTIDHAISQTFCMGFGYRSRKPNDPPSPSPKFAWMRPSNESPHLTGVLGMTGGLEGAESLLLHSFLQNIFASLGGAPNLADADIQGTANWLVKHARGHPIFDLQAENESGALAELIVKAAKSIKTPKMHLSLEQLQKNWKSYRDEYWSRNAEQLRHLTEQERGEEDKREQHAINETLAMMRQHRMLFQGTAWTCRSCQHRNWTDFQALTGILSCEVCQANTELPVDIPWHFRPNEFLIESLRSRSVLSVIWVLSALRRRARSSFMYVGPSCFGARLDEVNPAHEADLLAIVDGSAILCEVKSSWRSLREVDIQKLVALALIVRPDQAILAVMQDGGAFREQLQEAKRSLHAAGIAFELLTPQVHPLRDEPFALGS
ncbi:hypothetical protein [Pseudomonas sp. RIT-To-2]|uniref:hypothetical protein n=1 Tax=Pseudomonas sp. RIT-To-2 TaxID=3462541 RepID=UPI002413B209